MLEATPENIADIRQLKTALLREIIWLEQHGKSARQKRVENLRTIELCDEVIFRMERELAEKKSLTPH